MFRGSSTQLYVPPSHRRIFTNSSTLDFSHREPPLRIWVNTTWEYTTPLSNKYNLYTQRQGTTNSITSTLIGIGTYQTTNHLTLEGLGSKPLKHNHLTLEGFQHNLHLSLEGAKHHFHYHLSLEAYQLNHLSLEGCHKVRRVTTLGGLSQPQTNFLTKTRS